MMFAVIVALSVALCSQAAVAADAQVQQADKHLRRNLADSGLMYADLPTATDQLSWTYDDTQKGLNGVCSPTNKCGPSTWKNVQAVSPTVNQCGNTMQTPVNIQPLDVVNDATLTYPTLTVTSNGCTSWVQLTEYNVFKFSVSEAGNVCTNFQAAFGGTTYTLLQGHFHSPSEHQFGGSYFDAELHLVHKSSDGKLLVLAINFVADNGVIPGGAGHTLLNAMWNAATAAYTKTTGTTATSTAAAVAYDWAVTQTTPVDFYRGFLPPDKTFYTYTGSLTTYPCTEGVTFIVFEQPVRMSQTDLAILRGSVKANPKNILDPYTGNDNRPVNPLNGRIIKRFGN